MQIDKLVELLDGRKMNNFMKKASVQGLFRRNSELAERFRILFFALQAEVVTQLSWNPGSIFASRYVD